ncbi:MAG: ATP-binding protein [Candidatus Eremiobacteraeota bacterium]|nr:ATP-binding protein [Candidatus Eremiobacteraeota bacterium]
MITDRAFARDVTADDIRELITRRVAEENALEYKATVDTDLLKAACAMANFGGGFILIGVEEDDSHAASGIRHVDRVHDVADSVRQRLRDGLTPRPVFEVVPLTVDGKDLVITRIAPQNPPHMISADKKTDFYNRYDATSERMRYEEIEQAFRDKHEVAEFAPYQTPKAVIESTLGRTEISQGAKGFLDETVGRIKGRGEPTLALISANDGNYDSISEDDAMRAFREPLYYRNGGWLVAHPGFDVVQRRGVWEQPYGSASLTTITPSGDLVFVKLVDEILCWTQDERDFMVAPRLYPNALVEYCVSFAYMLADLAACARPTKVLLVPVVVANDTKLRLPLGEGGSIWYNAQIASAHDLLDQTSVGMTMLEPFELGRPILCRNLAFRLATQIYSFFGYAARDVPFSSDEEATVEPDADTATLTSLRAYMRDTLLAPVSAPREDFNRGCFVFAIDLNDGRRLLWVSEEFVDDYHFSEQKLFGFLDQFGLADRIRATAPKDKLLLSTSGVSQLPD